MAPQDDPRSNYVITKNRLDQIDEQHQLWTKRRDAAEQEMESLRNERAQLHAKAEELWNQRPAAQDPEPTLSPADERLDSRKHRDGELTDQEPSKTEGSVGRGARAKADKATSKDTGKGDGSTK